MKNQKQTMRQIVGFLNNPEEDGGFWVSGLLARVLFVEKAQTPMVFLHPKEPSANCSRRG